MSDEFLLSSAVRRRDALIQAVRERQSWCIGDLILGCRCGVFIFARLPLGNRGQKKDINYHYRGQRYK